MTVLARCEIILMMASSIAPLNVRFGKGSNASGRGRKRVCFMTIIALGNRLSILRIMRHESVRSDLLPARRHIIGTRCCKLIERSVTIQADLLGGRRCRGGGLWCAGWSSGCRSSRLRTDFKDDHRGNQEQKTAFEQRFKLSFHNSFAPGQVSQQATSPFPALRSYRLYNPDILPGPGHAGSSRQLIPRRSKGSGSLGHSYPAPGICH